MLHHVEQLSRLDILKTTLWKQLRGMVLALSPFHWRHVELQGDVRIEDQNLSAAIAVFRFKIEIVSISPFPSLFVLSSSFVI